MMFEFTDDTTLYEAMEIYDNYRHLIRQVYIQENVEEVEMEKNKIGPVTVEDEIFEELRYLPLQIHDKSIKLFLAKQNNERTEELVIELQFLRDKFDAARALTRLIGDTHVE